jgi:hypothetical protein
VSSSSPIQEGLNAKERPLNQSLHSGITSLQSTGLQNSFQGCKNLAKSDLRVSISNCSSVFIQEGLISLGKFRSTSYSSDLLAAQAKGL